MPTRSRVRPIPLTGIPQERLHGRRGRALPDVGLAEAVDDLMGLRRVDRDVARLRPFPASSSRRTSRRAAPRGPRRPGAGPGGAGDAAAPRRAGSSAGARHAAPRSPGRSAGAGRPRHTRRTRRAGRDAPRGPRDTRGPAVPVVPAAPDVPAAPVVPEPPAEPAFHCLRRRSPSPRCPSPSRLRSPRTRPGRPCSRTGSGFALGYRTFFQTGRSSSRPSLGWCCVSFEALKVFQRPGASRFPTRARRGRRPHMVMPGTRGADQFVCGRRIRFSEFSFLSAAIQ